MGTSTVRVERRVGQRFPYLLSLSLHQSSGGIEGSGFTQDLSSRGVFFITDSQLTEGAEIELTLKMPSEITLGDNIPVRCHGRVLRVERPTASNQNLAEPKIGVAARFDRYEYLPDPVSLNQARADCLHSNPEEERTSFDPRLRP